MGERATPIRQQYLRIKRRYPSAIVLFRLGDFYETFDEDARVASRELEIVLTSREMGKGNKVPLAGIPYHALDNYLARLINRGYRVAICEQVTKPGETKGIVQREVVRLVTPGTVVEPGLLDSKKNNYLVSLALGEEKVGLACVDITTSEFAIAELPLSRLSTELERIRPAEVIVAQGADLSALALTVPLTRLDDYRYEVEVARQVLLDHFGVNTLEGFGCANLPLAIGAAGAAIHYIQETQKGGLGQITGLSTYSTELYMALDVQTQRNLEIFQASRTGAVAGSLLSVIDLTRTAAGGRLLKRWLGQPLLDIKELNQRQDAIEWFGEHTLARARVISQLGEVADLERLTNRVRGGVAIPRELVALCRSLEAIPEIRGILAEEDGSQIDWLKNGLKTCQDVADLIAGALVEEPSSTFGEGEVIRKGFSEELDSLRDKSRNARQHLANMERQERERTGIKSLKIGFNNVFGYYIEVSKPNLGQVPDDYIRKQTLVGGERFFTAELKDYESLILNARDRITDLETSLFQQICRQVAAAGERIMEIAVALAHLDVFSSLAEIAVRHHYVRPVLNDGSGINIKQGRHPMVEQTLEDGHFVPNDTYLSNDGAQLIVLTGPNMSGKSTYLRQVALIVLLAQIGSFVPAEQATIGVVDRVFTRIGAGEDIAAGQSTFMVEMIETANILHNATPRSLIILDEIGRGTSTYDGLSIARAVAEYIHNSPRLGAKTLFATHYHEMVELAGYLPRVKNCNVAVREEAGEVIFLYKIVPGGVDRSYGIHVAQLAGLPRSVVHRAREVLEDLEGDSPTARPLSKKRRKETAQQLSFLSPGFPLMEELEKVDLDAMTPLEALNKLYELKKRAGEG
ncbi:MAG: DNA mismatch repair protein MutS [Dehalococcoidia bacterium SG8_51_3]|nr:MAG: DNA mismatch repair protein MutS [Dehalococcoidia bacterium SG8_51_3]